MAYKPPDHGRDHCPTGSDPCPCIGAQTFRALRYSNDLTSIGSVDAPLDWVNWEWSGVNSIFSPRKIGGGPDPVIGTDLMRSIRLVAEGWYTFTLGVHFTATVDGFKLVLNDGDPIFGRSDDIFGGPTTVYNTTGYCVGTWTRFYPLFDPFASGAHTVDVNFAVAVNAGGTRTIDEAYLDVARHSFHPGSPIGGA